MEILQEFGIKWELFAAQVVNFLILLFLLNRFLYKPLLKVLLERKGKIAQGLNDAEEIEKRLEKLELDREKKLEEVASEVKVILKDATDSASQIIEEAKQTATETAAKVLEQASDEIKLEGEKMRQQIRSEVAELVIMSLQKVTGKVLNKTDQKKLIEGSVKSLKIKYL